MTAEAIECRRCGRRLLKTPQNFYTYKHRDGSFGLRLVCKRCMEGGRKTRSLENTPIDYGDPIPYSELSLDARRLLHDFPLFFREFSGLGDLPGHALSWVSSIEAEDNVIINCPPRHAKTTCAEWYIVWRFAKDRQLQALLLSKSTTLAIRSARKIARELEYNTPLNSMYGRFRPLDHGIPWRPESGELQIEGRELVGMTGDLSLQVRGSRSQVLGMEALLVIADDVTDRSIAASETERNRELEWFRGECLSRLMPEGKAVLIGQRVGPRDIYSSLLGPDEFDERVWAHEVTPAVLDWGTKKREPTVLWPEQRPWKYIRGQRSRLGSVLFDSYFQQNPGLDDGSVLARDVWIDGCLDRQRGLNQPVPIPERDTVRVLSVDPSPSRYAGIVCVDVAIPKNRRDQSIYVVQGVWRPFDTGTDRLVSILGSIQAEYRANLCIIETNSLKMIQKDTIWHSIEDIFGGSRYVKRHTTTAVNKGSELIGLLTLSSAFEFGRVRLPYGTKEARDASDLLIQEALAQTVTDDILMALWFVHNNQNIFKYYTKVYKSDISTGSFMKHVPGVWGGVFSRQPQSKETLAGL